MNDPVCLFDVAVALFYMEASVALNVVFINLSSKVQKSLQNKTISLLSLPYKAGREKWFQRTGCRL